MRALVTGCAGFIGSHLTDRLLTLGYDVIGIDRFSDYYPKDTKLRNLKNIINNPNFELIEENILDIDFKEMPDIDYIFHQAAQAGVRKSWGRDFRTYIEDNILATQKILEEIKDEGIKDSQIKKFIYASSSSVYGNVELPMREDSVLRPISPYGVTKLAAENLCYLYWKNYDIPTVSLRYFTVYGPRQRPDMAIHKFVNAILEDKEIIIFGNGEQTRDFTYVDDAIDANILAMNSDPGEIFNVGGGSRISINQLLWLMEDIIGKKANIKYIEKQKGDAEDTLADIGKVKEKIGWMPKIKIREGLLRYIGWLNI